MIGYVYRLRDFDYRIAEVRDGYVIVECLALWGEPTWRNPPARSEVQTSLLLHWLNTGEAVVIGQPEGT